jgi:FixJ family two-component response regulator
VLIVEDNDATLAGLSELLKRAGYRTYATRSFEEGARVMREDTPDVLIADIRLGSFNGLQLLVTSPTRVPTIIMTGYPDPVLEADAVHLGAQFILKPVSPAALLAMVESQLAKTRARDTNRRWARKQPGRELVARVDNTPVQIIDLSYGGMRLALAGPASRPPQSSLDVLLPDADLSVHVNIVWSSLTSDGTWLCGAALTDADQGTARAWHGLVDTVA